MRPKKNRKICCYPNARIFKPRGIPARELKMVELKEDELEAIRLADHEGFHHEKAGEMMGVSRATFGRIVQGARKKVAMALVEGLGIHIKSAEKEDETCDSSSFD